MFARFLIAGFFAFSLAWAQTSTGTIEGQARDASGAVVPEARIVVTNSNTGVINELQTNAEGRFVVPFLLPGTYQVTIEKPGFQRYSESRIKLNVSQTRSLEVTLALGDVATTVEIQSEAGTVDTVTSTVATTIGNKAILDLPLNGRNPYSLALLTPGVIPTSGTSIPWISGGRNATSEISIDGTSVILPENNVSINTLSYTPPVDAVEEFTVLTNALSAEYGRSGGGVINLATRHGGNDLHGSAYDFLRNAKLDANNFFSNKARIPRRAFQRNQFGYTLGGPVFLPKLYDGRNRTFFFTDYQGTRTRSASVFTTTVPLDSWKQGDFSNLKTAGGTPILIYDPLTTRPDGSGGYTREPFPGNRIPDARVDPVARKLMSYFPAPNTVPVNANTQINNFTGAEKAPSGDNRYDIRIDHNISSAFRMFGRYSYNKSYNTPVNFFRNIATPSGDGPGSTDNYSANLDSTYLMSATSIVNVRYAFGRFFNVRSPFSTGFDPTTIGFPAYVRDVGATQNLEFPRFDIQNLSSLGQNTFTTLRFVPNSHIVVANWTKVLARHTIKTGIEYRKLLLNFLQLGNPDGQYSFDQRWSQRNPNASSATEGFGLASLLLGLPSGGSVSHDPTPASASSYWAGFVQDDFRVNSKLTLNIGLRYEVDVPRTERYNRLSYFDLDAPSPISGKVPGFPNLKGAMRFTDANHRRQTPTDLNNFGPRFGFAYKLTERTVARGAYAVMYAGSVMQAAGHTGSAGMEGYRSSTPFITSLDNRTPINYLRNPYPDGFNLPPGTSGPLGGPNTNIGLGIGESFFIDYRNPVIQQWNFDLQRELPGNVVVEAGYIASKGNHLIDGEGSMTYNQLPFSYAALGASLDDLVPNPFFGIITNPSSTLSRETVQRRQLLRPYPQYSSLSAFRKPQGNSLYHAFTLRAEKRYSKGLDLLLAYTGGKLIDDSSQTVTFLGPAGNKQDFYNRAAERAVSTQDVSSRLVMSVVYDLPVGHGRHFLSSAPGVVDWVLGGWQVNGILTFQTGTPIVLTQSQNNTGLGNSAQRPNNNGHTGKITGGTKDERLNKWFDPSVFSVAPPFTFGNVGRTLPDVRNPGQRNADLSLFKNFHFHEDRGTLQFRVEAFNATNTTQFSAPAATVGNSNIGIISSTAVGPRQVQLALKILF